MKQDFQTAVAEQSLAQHFDELAGRSTPPDRLQAILQRVAQAPDTAGIRRSAPRAAQLWVAALVLLGLTATVGVALLEHGTGPKGNREPAAGAPFVGAVVAQEPVPKPTGKPSATQEPKPAPKPEVPKPEAPKPEKTGDGKPGDAKPGDVKSGDVKSGPAQVVPKGTDPADLAVLRSAEAMLEAERKLAERLKDGKLVGIDQILPFDELTSWPYEDGLKGMPKRIKDLDGKKVLMTGFMLPIDEVQHIKEFLLVKSLWSCCYGKPPDIHGIVRVVMPKGKPTDYRFDPLKIVGTFHVEATVLDGYCVDIYQLHVELLETIQ